MLPPKFAFTRGAGEGPLLQMLIKLHSMRRIFYSHFSDGHYWQSHLLTQGHRLIKVWTIIISGSTSNGNIYLVVKKNYVM